MGAIRPVTRARRDFGADGLAGLDREELRKLCHGLLLAEGVTVTEVRRQADFVDFAVSASTLWHHRRTLVRLWYNEISQSDLDDGATFIDAMGFDDALFLAVVEPPPGLTEPHGIHLIPPGDTKRRIIGSPLASWDDHGPSVAVDRLDLVLRLEQSDFFDRIGVQWLPSVALNELPPSLLEAGVEPQDVLERKTFRVLTASLLFDGVRYGEAARGKRLPDAVLRWPDGSACSALVDCKAAANGYVMDSDHFLRFVRYWDDLAPELEGDGVPPQYLLVISSHFPGTPGDRHPFHARAEDLLDKTGLKLCYVKASDIAWLAATVEQREIPLHDRRRLNWHEALANGIVATTDLMAMLGEGA